MGKGTWARSYRRNQGNITRAQRRALRNLWSEHGLTYRWDQPLKLPKPPVSLHIGFGHGEALVALAADRPKEHFLGVEVHRPGLGAALLKIDEQRLDNVNIVRGDIFEVLSNHVEGRPFNRACIFFPEPWPSAPERRIVRPLLLDLLSERMQPDGLLYIATDKRLYLEHVQSAIESVDGWVRAEGYGDRPDWRPVTKYEQRALAAGRQVYEMRYANRDH